MARALWSACLVVVMCVAGPAWASKRKIAVLGLEAAPGSSGAVEPATTQVARGITRDLRQRVQAAASPFVLAPNSNKELTDEKLLMSCDNEAPSCMVVIGAGLAADVLLYGRVEKRGGSYRVSLKLLDVKTKAIEAGSEDLPVGSSAAAASKRLYARLIRDIPVVGTLIVKATSQTGIAVKAGAVMVDEERKGPLVAGRLTVTGLVEGRHTIAIEAGGYRRFEEVVVVRVGEQATLSAVMLEQQPDAPPPRASGASTVWKVSLGASLVVAAAGGLTAGYGYLQQNRSGDRLNVVSSTTATLGVEDCGSSEAEIMDRGIVDYERGAFDDACKWHKVQLAGFGALIVGGAGALLSIIMLSWDDDSPERTSTGSRGKKSSVAIVPVVTPGSAGASLSLTW